MANDRILELKSARDTQLAEADRILATITDETGEGHFVLSTEKKSAYQKASKNAAEIQGLIDLAEANSGMSKGVEVKNLDDKGMESKGLGADAIAEFRDRGLQEISDRLGGLEGKSIGELFLESSNFLDYKGSPTGDSERFDLEFKDVHTAMPGTMTNLGFGKTQRDPIVLRQHRTSRVRDLFPVQQTTANMIEFYRVTGLVNNAAPVAERDTTTDPDTFGLKPQSSLSFEPVQAIVRTLAHWEVAHRNVLDDEPQLRGIIDTELLYGLRLVEDAQILSGNGTGENLLGILVTPGIQTYAWSDGPETSDNKADAVRRSITKVILSNYEATGVVLNPLDWEDIELTKDGNERYLVTIGVAIGAEQRLWRLPVTDTPAMAQGTWLTGAFGLAAQLYDRMAPNIRLSEHHADTFVRNALTILAEQRLTVAVKRPEAFVKGTFDSAPV